MRINWKSDSSTVLVTIIVIVIGLLALSGLYFQTGYTWVSHYTYVPSTTIISSATPFQEASILTVIPTTFQPIAMAFDPDNRMVYASTSNGSQSEIVVISDSTNTIIATIPFPEKNPSVLVFDDSYSNLYAYDTTQGDIVYVINPATNSLIGNISTGAEGMLGGAVFNPNNQDLYIAGGATNSVIVISTTSNRVVQTVSVQGNPTFITFSPSTGYIYVESQNGATGLQSSDEVIIINPIATIPAVTNTIVSILELSAYGSGISAVSGDIFALTNSPVALDVISSETNQISHSVVFPSRVSFGTPSNLAYDQSSGLLFMSMGKNLTEFNPETNSIRGLQLPSQVAAIAVDAATGNFYVSLYGMSEVLELSP